MEAQPILPVKATSVRPQESAARSLSDVFQAMLRERETRELPERHETARSFAARSRFDRDDAPPPAEPRRPDDPRETRGDDRYAEPRDGRPDARHIEATQRGGHAGDANESRWSDESRRHAENTGRDAEAATLEAGAEETIDVARINDAPGDVLQAGPAADNAPDPAVPDAPAAAAEAAKAAPHVAEVAGGVAAQARAAAAQIVPANPKAPETDAPRPSLTPASLVADPHARAAADATRDNAPAAHAAATLVDAALGKRPGTPGPQAGAATAPAGAARAPARTGGENQSPAAPWVKPAQAKEEHDTLATAERAENAARKTNAPAAKALAVPAGQADANQAARANPAVLAASQEGLQRQAPAANDPTVSAPSFKATVGSGTTGQAQAGLTGIDPMLGAARAPGIRPASTPTADRPVTLNDVVVNIQRAAARGEDRIRIRLHPAELGQVDVRLKVGADGIVRAIVQVERPETLDFMQRDARGLERALQDAGLKTDSGSLSFNLRDNGQGGLRERGDDAPAPGRDEARPNTPPPPEEAETPVQTGWSGRALDIRV